MRSTLLPKLICPNSKSTSFVLYAAELLRNGQTIENVDNESIMDSDDITLGYLIADQRFVYPIRYGVLSLLSDDDVDTKHFEEQIAHINQYSESWKELTEQNVTRMKARQESQGGSWNRAEMRYYDDEVDTEEKRESMCDNIRDQDLPHIFIPREKHILGLVKPSIKAKLLVEIGCGNARTITRMMPPNQYDYQYIGTDISFYRLVVAKMACPQGEFVQASAFNLPFRDDIADVGISFGMLHHLPVPIEGVRDLNRVLKQKCELGIHEPIETEKIVVGKHPRIEAALATYDHSERDGEIDLSLIHI